MARRQRIDSAAGAVATMAAAARDLSPPKHIKLRRGDLPFWNAVIAERAKSEWTDADLSVAANLARTMADAERIAAFPVDGGGHIRTAALIATIGVADKLARRIVTLRRALGVDSRAKNGEQRDVNKRRDHALGLEADLSAVDDDDLIARPTVQ